METDAATLASALVALVMTLGSLFVIKFVSQKVGKAVKNEEISQTRQGEGYKEDD